MDLPGERLAENGDAAELGAQVGMIIRAVENEVCAIAFSDRSENTAHES
jgi:hypothetical protein